MLQADASTVACDIACAWLLGELAALAERSPAEPDRPIVALTVLTGSARTTVIVYTGIQIVDAAEALADAGRYDGKVIVEAYAADAGSVAVSVRDNGPGFEPELAKRAMMPFTTTKGDGLGLGLSLAHTIVEKHGGRLSIESTSSGAAVSFTLPALATLSDREREILRLRFGIGTDHEHTLAELGARLSLTRERIRQIRERAFEKLRESPDGKALKGFWRAA